MVEITDAAVSGVVKWFNSAKGFGFIKMDGTEPPREIFVHATDIKKSSLDESKIDEGVALRFDVQATPRGAKACNLSLI